ncbi:MAG TPA: hypothetical protein VD905_11480, partial [Flavobacteriales bacterium]|nr:hypothetical protein [Flavobacteriales bacterium]
SEDWELWFRVLANYGIKTDNRISARMFNHNDRSVMAEAQQIKLVQRKELALKYAFEDEAVKRNFGKWYKTIDAFGESYIALHLVLIGNNKLGIKHLKKFVRGYPMGIFTRRFLVIVKCIIFNLFKSRA